MEYVAIAVALIVGFAIGFAVGTKVEHDVWTGELTEKDIRKALKK